MDPPVNVIPLQFRTNTVFQLGARKLLVGAVFQTRQHGARRSLVGAACDISAFNGKSMQSLNQRKCTAALLTYSFL